MPVTEEKVNKFCPSLEVLSDKMYGLRKVQLLREDSKIPLQDYKTKEELCMAAQPFTPD
jgi:hypothetical protein